MLPIRSLIHMGLHIVAPGVMAWLFWRPTWRRAWLVMVLTMIVDMDHLLVAPIFDAHRCGIGFHPLHSWWAIGVYLGSTLVPRTRLLGVGLVIHMALDAVDCAWIALA